MDEAVAEAWDEQILGRLQQNSKAAAVAAGRLGRALAMRGHPKSQVDFQRLSRPYTRIPTSTWLLLLPTRP